MVARSPRWDGDLVCVGGRRVGQVRQLKHTCTFEAVTSCLWTERDSKHGRCPYKGMNSLLHSHTCVVCRHVRALGAGGGAKVVVAARAAGEEDVVLAIGQYWCGRLGHQVGQDFGAADADVDGLRGPPRRADGKQLVGAGRRHKVAGRRNDGEPRGRRRERARHL